MNESNVMTMDKRNDRTPSIDPETAGVLAELQTDEPGEYYATCGVYDPDGDADWVCYEDLDPAFQKRLWERHRAEMLYYAGISADKRHPALAAAIQLAVCRRDAIGYDETFRRCSQIPMQRHDLRLLHAILDDNWLLPFFFPEVAQLNLNPGEDQLDIEYVEGCRQALCDFLELEVLS